MGFRITESMKAKCPLYEQVVHARNGHLSGVQCAMLFETSDFGAKHILRFKNWDETLSYKSKYCDNDYMTCPYYLAWMRENGF